MKIYIGMWLLVHLFLAGFLFMVYFLAGVAIALSDVLCGVGVLFFIEFLVFGFMFGATKLMGD